MPSLPLLPGQRLNARPRVQPDGNLSVNRDLQGVELAAEVLV